MESAPSFRNTRLSSKILSKPPTSAFFRKSSGAIRRYRSISSAFECVMKGRAAAPPARVCKIGVSNSKKSRRCIASRIARITATRCRAIWRASGRTMRST
ncbi:Uncharacterised protein [Mycobacteroides abscessus subsp. abscessus]|nr:Uncharacterised protein [Mycobacteroides abscessus subsp. abscessus]